MNESVNTDGQRMMYHDQASVKCLKGKNETATMRKEDHGNMSYERVNMITFE